MDAMTHTDSVRKALTQLTWKRHCFRSLTQWIVALLRSTFAAMANGLFKFEIAPCTSLCLCARPKKSRNGVMT